MNSPDEPLHPLAQLCLQRMKELDLTYEAVTKRGGPPTSTLFSLCRKGSTPPGLPHQATLGKLAKALDLPLQVVKDRAIESVGYVRSGSEQSRRTNEDFQMIEQAFWSCGRSRQRLIRAAVEALASVV